MDAIMPTIFLKYFCLLKILLKLASTGPIGKIFISVSGSGLVLIRQQAIT